MRRGGRTGVLGLAVAALVLASCQPPEPSVGARLAASYLGRLPIAAVPAEDLREATAVQVEVVAALTEALGPVVGYKAGLTSVAAQQRFGVSEPVAGRLLEKMLLASGDTVAGDFGTRPLFEGDLLVRVRSDALNTAETDAEIAAALDAVVPFLELPDLAYAPEVPLTGPALVAVNVGARLGVQGEAVPLASDGDSAWAQLERIHLRLYDGDSLQAEAPSTALLGHPGNVVRWLRDRLRAQGVRLKRGDLLSLGSLTPLFPIRPGQHLRARYTGFPERESVWVEVWVR